MSWMAPIIASQTREENEENEDKIVLRRKKISILVTVLTMMFSIGMMYYGDWSSISRIPSIFIILIIISVIRIISISRAQTRRRRQNNFPKKEIYSNERNIQVSRNLEKTCPRCGSTIDRDIDNQSFYYCSHCGYEIKNSRR